ncbi:NO-inducible flavohemoprotein [Sphingobacterium thalpophilum]|uniref:Flavohemoprotein n=1 Tax=Sphingobacterium thalpophilum TaxID=259 RepID=A0A4U9W5C4_9SPHI|nr:NO-inducible flavohemoprotein [Sphingobacterium thalpophilum]VTR53981.1 Nitric oxide dioxygenase [Sphingobacterium thalpophilum]
MITEAQKDLIKGTIPVLRAHGVALTSHFYKRMFTHNPELKHLFNLGNQQNSRQQTALATAVLAYAEHIDNPAALLSAVKHIGQKHASLHIRPEHYQIVGKHLLASIQEVLGEAASTELIEAWKVAYFQLADIMIGVEKQLYDTMVQTEGGWTGWKPFHIVKVVAETAEIQSIYLEPTDGGRLPAYKPGQYVSVRVYLPELHLYQPRQYSLSDASNGRYFRISVKKEVPAGKPQGMVSNYLHEYFEVGKQLELTAPTGSFHLIENALPHVFISGGVGQTPLMAMLEHLADTKAGQPITWIHGCRNNELHAFKNRIQKLQMQHAAMTCFSFYDEPQADSHSFAGWVDLAKIDRAHLPQQANYYLCGPAGFIEKHFQYLTAQGIDPANIHFEEFGPASLQLN